MSDKEDLSYFEAKLERATTPEARAKYEKQIAILKMTQKTVEEQIQEKGLNAPRITPDHIQAKVVKEQYHTFEGTTFMVCLLTLENGFNVSGESACASPENFDEEIGKRIARENAVQKIWALEGYLLKERLYENDFDRIHDLEPIPSRD